MNPKDVMIDGKLLTPKEGESFEDFIKRFNLTPEQQKFWLDKTQPYLIENKIIPKAFETPAQLQVADRDVKKEPVVDTTKSTDSQTQQVEKKEDPWEADRKRGAALTQVLENSSLRALKSAAGQTISSTQEKTKQQ